MYQTISRISNKFFKNRAHTLFKVLFNLSPMYRRSTGRLISVAENLMRVEVKIPLSYKNKNYVGTIFGGSLFSATDPIYMIQLIQILGKDYVVWDKSSVVEFKRPANSDAYALFEFSEEEIEQLKQQVSDKREYNLIKNVSLKSKEGKVFCQIEKTIYVADKDFYKEKRRRKEGNP